MKLASIIMGTIWVTMISCSQEIPASKVPSIVQNAVQSKFPGAGEIDWEKDGVDFKAEFEMQQQDHEVLIDPSGNFVALKKDIASTELPEAITAAIARDYATFKIDDVDSIERGGISYFQVELDTKGSKDEYLVFKSDGTLADGVKFFK